MSARQIVTIIQVRLTAEELDLFERCRNRLTPKGSKRITDSKTIRDSLTFVDEHKVAISRSL